MKTNKILILILVLTVIVSCGLPFKMIEGAANRLGKLGDIGSGKISINKLDGNWELTNEYKISKEKLRKEKDISKYEIKNDSGCKRKFDVYFNSHKLSYNFDENTNCKEIKNNGTWKYFSDSEANIIKIYDENGAFLSSFFVLKASKNELILSGNFIYEIDTYTEGVAYFKKKK